MNTNRLRVSGSSKKSLGAWKVPVESVVFDERGIKSRLLDLEQPCYVVHDGQRIGVSHEARWQGSEILEGNHLETLTWVPPLSIGELGDPDFRRTHGLQYPYYAGSMANGIASEEMVIVLGKAGFLASFGAAGLLPERIEEAIVRIQQALPQGPYAFNLIHSPSEPLLERKTADLYLTRGVNCVEAAAFLQLTPHVVQYRVAGLSLDPQNKIQIKNRIIAKVSHREVATKFMEPAPPRILKRLLEQKLITESQANLSQKIPMADDVTVEADSAGHTDNRPMFAVLPSILDLRDEIQEKYAYEQPIRVGAGGGIATPSAALATFMMGAAYVVTGSINQSCIEAGASVHAKKLLAQADISDVIMAPASDMFEMGTKVQVLKKGTLFALRANKLYDLYTRYNSLEEIPLEEREKLEKKIFRNSLDSIWESTVAHFSERDPDQIQRAVDNPKRRMALVFRWYLGLSSRWSITGEPGREIDYQIWCGPSMGAFNAWVRNSYLADVNNRRVVDVAKHILTGAAFLYRVQYLKMQGAPFLSSYLAYHPHHGMGDGYN